MLSSFPADLKEFFKHILDSVNPFYNDKMARTLLIALHADKPLCIDIFMSQDLEYDDENYAFKEPDNLMPATLTELNRVFGSVSRRINGRCKCLLERNADRMEFLHRTVYDFLRTPEVAEFLKKMAKPNFCPSLSLFQASIAWVKRTKFNDVRMNDSKVSKVSLLESNSFVHRMRQTLQYAISAEKAGESSAALAAALLDNMEASIGAMLKRGQIIMGDQSMVISIYRHLALEARISVYIGSKLSSPDCISNKHAKLFQPTLSYFFDPKFALVEDQALSCLQEVLRSGHDLNQRYEGNSPWEAFLNSCIPAFIGVPASKLQTAMKNGVLSTLLQNGADAGTLIDMRTDRIVKIPAWLGIILTILHVQPRPPNESWKPIVDSLLQSVQNIEDVKIEVQSARDDTFVEHNFWDICRSTFPLVFRNTYETLVIEVFGRVLQRIPRQTPKRKSAFIKAQDWIRNGLSAYGGKQFESTMSNLETQRGARSSRKRKLESQVSGSDRSRKSGRKRNGKVFKRPCSS